MATLDVDGQLVGYGTEGDGTLVAMPGSGVAAAHPDHVAAA